MPDISVNFVHPTSGKTLAVTLDDGMTAQEAIGQLLENQFVPQLPNGYELGVKGGSRLRSDESFAAARVASGAMIQVLPATEAGLSVRKRDNVGC
jgi:hypothetical protein